MLVTDLSRVYRRMTGIRLWRIFLCFLMPGFQAVKLYRVGRWLLSKPRWMSFFVWPFYFYLRYRMWKRWGINISLHADIGNGFLITHFGCIFVGPAKIGKNCTITHDVTIGGGGSGQRYGEPSLGDNVHVAAGARLFGKITIGNNVRIGPNAVVHRDVPDNAVVQVRPVQVVTFSSLNSPSAENQGDEVRD